MDRYEDCIYELLSKPFIIFSDEKEVSKSNAKRREKKGHEGLHASAREDASRPDSDADRRSMSLRRWRQVTV